MPVVKDKTKSKPKAKSKAQVKQKAKAKAKASAKVVSNIQNKIIIGDMPKKRKVSTAKGKKTTKSTPQEQYRQPITNVFQPQVASFQPPTPFVNSTTRLLEEQPKFNLLTERVNRLEAASLIRPPAIGMPRGAPVDVPVVVPLRYPEAEPEVIINREIPNYEPIKYDTYFDMEEEQQNIMPEQYFTEERQRPVITPEREEMSLQFKYGEKPIKKSKVETPVYDTILDYFEKKQPNKSKLISEEEIPITSIRAPPIQEKTKQIPLVLSESEYENVIDDQSKKDITDYFKSFLFLLLYLR
jgi:hypothetical protein